MFNASCLDLNMLNAVVKSVLLGLTADNTLQVGLLDCSGSPLGKARVPTCDQMQNTVAEAAATLANAGVRVATDDTLQGDGTTAKPLKVNVCGILTSVTHDTTLSGYGTCQSPLTVNTSWLRAFVLDLADTTAMIHIAPDSGISGDGTTNNPLALTIVHDTSMDGAGTKASPLAVDTEWLATQIKDVISATGISTADGGGIAGNGSSTQPLSLAINHDGSLDGDGTKAKPLGVDTDWLASQMSDELTPTNGAAPLNVTENGTISTNIVGSQDQTLGKPDGWAKLENGYLVPLYKVSA